MRRCGVWTKLFLLCGILSLSAGSLWAQSQVSTADLKGSVTDQSGAVMPGVTITISDVDKGRVRQIVTDDRGQYVAPLLSPAPNYEVKAELSGFATQIKKGLTLTVGQSVIVDFKLEVAGTATEIVVTTATPLIETERIQQSNVIEEKRISIEDRTYAARQ